MLSRININIYGKLLSILFAIPYLLSSCTVGSNSLLNLTLYNFYYDTYAIQYEDTIYFTSFYDNLYSLQDNTVTLLEEDFNAWSMTRLGDTLYYLTPNSNGNTVFCARKLSKDGPLEEPETLYEFSGSPNKAWTDGESVFVLGSKEVARIPLDGGTEDCWPVEYCLPFSALVWNGEIYLNAGSYEKFSLIALNLDTGETRTVSEAPAVAYGVENGTLCLRNTASNADGPVPLTAGNGAVYAYDTHTDGATHMIDLYIQEGDDFTLAASIPETSSLISPAVYQVGDSLLIRSFYPAEVDRNLTGKELYGSAAYQYLLEPDGTLTLLVQEKIETPLS